MIVLTEKTKNKLDRNNLIKTEYSTLMRPKGSQRYAVYELLATKYNISETQIGRIVGNIK